MECEMARDRMMVRNLFIGAAFLMLSVGAAAESGIVASQETGKPLPGTVAVAFWTANVPNPVQSVSECYHLSVAVADLTGRFEIDDTPLINPLHFNRKRHLVFYHPEHSSEPVQRKASTVYLKPFVGTPEERFRADLNLWGWDCPKKETKLLPLAKAMYSEAKALAQNERQESVVSNMLFLIERDSLGEDQAFTNQSKRWREIISKKRDVK
jgi:hypothetical protein